MPQRSFVRSRRGAYLALVLLTLIWGFNWIALKSALLFAHPVLLNVHRTFIAALILFAILIGQRRPLWPTSWIAVIITAFFQTTVNFGSTTMALAEGGAGRTSVIAFTMPFWTLLLAWPVLNERVRGGQWLAVALALAGLVLVVEPWYWQDGLQAKLWAVLGGFGWAAGTVATKYFQRRRQFDLLNFLAWQMLVGVAPLMLLPSLFGFPGAQWGVQYALLLLYIAGVSTAFGFLLWIAVLRFLSAGTASLNILAVPVIALMSSMLIFDERLTGAEWTGIACIGCGLAILSLGAWRDGAGKESGAVAGVPIDRG